MTAFILIAIYAAIGYAAVKMVCDDNDSTAEKFFFGAIWPAVVFPAAWKTFVKK